MRQRGDKVRPGKGRRQQRNKAGKLPVSVLSNDALNHRLRQRTRELDEALQQQAATSEVLSIIRKSPVDAQPVFEAIVESAARLCGAIFSVVYLQDNDRLRFAATKNFSATAINQIKERQDLRQINRSFVGGRAILDRAIVQIPDVLADPEYSREFALAGGWRAVLAVPLLHEGTSVGAITVGKAEPTAFSEQQIRLLQTFADQAVIAIENARLFNETQEALERQTATAEVLRVISSSPGELGPVFEAMLENAVRICRASFGTLLLYEGDRLRRVARMAAQNVPQLYAPDQETPPHFIAPFDGAPSLRRLVETKALVHIADIATEHPDDLIYKVAAARTVLIVPMLKESELVGAFAVYRKEVHEFSDKQVELLENFAAQAVIAIENTRLLNELRQRTDDLSESLERQTATADILKVIASSPDDVQPVFQAIAEESNDLLKGLSTAVFSLTDDVLHLMAHTTVNPAADASLRAVFPRPLSTLVFNDAIRKGEVCFVSDREVEYAAHPEILESARLRGWRSALYVPLRRDGKSIGMISVTRREPGSFAEQHVQLLQTFADQAVIAIENARLFNETKEALERQTSTAEVLRVIASSPSDLQPVFEAIATRSTQLVGGHSAAVSTFVDDMIQLGAFTPVSPEADAALKALYPRRLTNYPLFELVHGGEVAQVSDIETDTRLPSAARATARARGFRSLLLVPMNGDTGPIGVITVTRKEPGTFAAQHIQLLQTFADQAVIAIKNVQLFEQVQARTKELAKSLEELRAAQDRLVQTEKLASLGQLTAGIAHEIKNPLNFVNNFAALSVELTDELKGALKPAALDRTLRADVDEITGLLKDNLGKVVQHGKRADSIVRNMLLHSREGSGECRSAEINRLVEESLSLAFHGARAEKPGFTITLRHDLDLNAGALDLYPQEITRALLNLISNGFYAATRRKIELSDDSFEPLLSAATRDLGDAVEIRIRDNGTGIPPEVKEKMFNPFFTTKPSGEGTGLGLSMTHDIIVKQHGGRIDVETEPGIFTEVIITLPRGNVPVIGEKPE